MKLRKLAALAAVALSHVSGLYAQGSIPTPPIVWKLATGYRAESFHTENITQFSRDIERDTAGQLSIQVHPNNTLAKLNDISKAVESGQVEAGETILSSLVKDVPIAGADSVPFVVASYKDARRMWRLQRPILERHLARRGLTLLYTVPWPPQGLHSVRTIHSAADFKGTRMRTYNPTTIRIAELLGAQPVDVPMVDVGKALAEGRMDSMITSAVTGVENKVWSSIRFYYEINAWFPKNAVFVNSKAFSALRPEVRQAVRKSAGEAEVRGWEASQAAALSATEELRRNGVKIERIPGDLDLEIKRMGERFSREWVRSVGNEANDIFVPYYTQP